MADNFWRIPGALSNNSEKEDEEQELQFKPAITEVKKEQKVVNEVCVGTGEYSMFLFNDIRMIGIEKRSHDYEGIIKFEKKKDEYDVDFLSIDAKKGHWKIKTKHPAHIVEDISTFLDEKEIEGNQQLATIDCLGKRFFLFIEKKSRVENVYHNYQILKTVPVIIGKSVDCDIVYRCPFIDGKHIEITWKNGEWRLKNIGRNETGLFVNNRRNKELKVAPGDALFLFGLRIVFGLGFLAIKKDSLITVADDNLRRIVSEKDIMLLESPREVYRESSLFNRKPRQRLPLIEKEIRIDGPPMSMNGNQMPLFLRMGSSMVMGGTAAMAGSYTMLLSSVFFPLMSNRYTEKERKEYEAKRIEKYGQYLRAKEKEIKKEKIDEETTLLNNYPSLETVLKYPEAGDKLWERRIQDDDFLNIRVGHGDIPLIAKIAYPEERFDMNEDELEDKMYELATNKVMLNDVPIMVDLLRYFVCSVTGKPKLAKKFVKNLVLMISILHSYDELKIVFLADQEDLDQFDYIKYLPHVWNDQRTVRFVASTSGEAGKVGEYLRNELEADLSQKRSLKEILKVRPYYIVIAISKKLFDDIEMFKEITPSDENKGITIITCFEDVPKDCTLLIDIKDTGENEINYIKDIEKQGQMFVADEYKERDALTALKIVSNTSLKTVAESYSLPKMLSFLEMFGVGRVDFLEPLKRWKDNNPVKSLATPIGVGTDGELFYLDIHEKFQGPHGLVAGTTGSGKSEFLMTYILSMAVNYDPDEVAFVLIDFKGGGLADAFDNPKKGIHLPHLVGTITNLDGASMNRTLISIQSEMDRRQNIFKAVKEELGEGTMDIYSYQRFYRNGMVSEPMPHLIIISDEFAELKQQQPDFMNNLISAARIGRSLGVHLVLATQKPSGVVDEQIRSNTKFRVCLKVQDKTDSQDMLKRPEAAEITETGRFYMQVGYNEFFALGQSAWSGADYEPQDEVATQVDNSIEVMDVSGEKILEIQPDITKPESMGSQLVAIVRMLSNLASSQGYVQKSLWKPELKKVIDINDLNDVQGASKYYYYFGIVDDPEKQRQFKVGLDIAEMNNLLVVGDTGCGKTTFIETMLSILSESYSSEELQYYILDYSSRTMKVFNKLPHCGGVFMEEDNASLEQLFKLISELVTERKKLFLDLEVDSFSAALEKRKMPLILVVIDGLVGLTGSKMGEAIGYNLQNYLREGSSYGIKYVISASFTSQIPIRIRQELSSRVCFHLKDKYDYSEMIPCKISYLPANMTGRGLYEYEGRALEFQAGKIFPDENGAERVKKIKEHIDSILSACDEKCVKARRLPVVDKEAEYEDFAEQFAPKRIPLGFASGSGKSVALPLRQLSRLSLYFGKKEGKEIVLGNIIKSIRKEADQLIIVKRNDKSFFDDLTESEGVSVKWYNSEKSDTTKLWNELSAEINKRKELINAYCDEEGIDRVDCRENDKLFNYVIDNMESIFVIIEDMGDFCSSLDMIANMVFDKIFMPENLNNIYVIGVYEPNARKKSGGSMAYMSFADKTDAVFFGGNYIGQDFFELSESIMNIQDEIPINFGIMDYKERICSFTMPCGKIEIKEQNPDKSDIFA